MNYQEFRSSSSSWHNSHSNQSFTLTEWTLQHTYCTVQYIPTFLIVGNYALFFKETVSRKIHIFVFFCFWFLFTINYSLLRFNNYILHLWLPKISCVLKVNATFYTQKRTFLFWCQRILYIGDLPYKNIFLPKWFLMKLLYLIDTVQCSYSTKRTFTWEDIAALK